MVRNYLAKNITQKYNFIEMVWNYLAKYLTQVKFDKLHLEINFIISLDPRF